jgi:N-acetylneuraminic acid mutarotase
LAFTLVVTVPDAEVAASSGNWRTVESMSVGRFAGHLAILLPNGQVLVVAGNDGGDGSDAPLLSAELFDPMTGQWSQAASMRTRRTSPAGTRLADGRVLIAGGFDHPAAQVMLASAEAYDPMNDSWSSAGMMTQPRAGATAILLGNGKVLVVGGMPTFSVGVSDTAELYDPQTNEWSAVPSMSTPRAFHTATLLQDERVFVVGGSAVPTAEIFDPVSNHWLDAGAMSEARFNHGAALLHDGRVLLAGGQGATNRQTADIFDPNTRTWAQASNMSTPRGGITAVTLASGEVLVSGGLLNPDGSTATAEIYNAETDAWRTAGTMNEDRYYHTQTVLADGSVLVVGGCCELARPYARATAEIFTLSSACPEDVTERVQIFQSRFYRIPFTPFRFQWAVFRNDGNEPIQGPLAFVMVGLRNAVLLGSRLKTVCFSPSGDPFVVVHPGRDDVLSPGELALSFLLFRKTAPGHIAYTPKVLSGIPTD